MPVTIQSTSGNSYHLFQLPNECAPEPSFGIGLTTIENEMCQGYGSGALLGLSTGVRTFGLTFPTISAYGTQYEDPYGNMQTRHEYLRHLHQYNRTTGEPFAYQHPDTGQYYLVDFEGTSITFAKRKNVSIYKTDVTLKQRRIRGETIFEVPEAGHHFDHTTHNSPAAGDWGNLQTLGQYLTAAGGVVFDSNVINGYPTVRLNGSSGYLSGNMTNVIDLVIALKYRAATFANAGGLLTGAGNIIRGTNAGTKWQDPSLAGFQYWYNGKEYAAGDMQAPMDVIGVCHFHFATPVTITTFGKDAGTVFLAADLAEMVINDGAVSTATMLEVGEHLKNKWGVTD